MYLFRDTLYTALINITGLEKGSDHDLLQVKYQQFSGEIGTNKRNKGAVREMSG
jgi:hypothetical protein